MDLEVVGRHTLLFDDDAMVEFTNFANAPSRMELSLNQSLRRLSSTYRSSSTVCSSATPPGRCSRIGARSRRVQIF
ncbi:unnamed protein product [Linum trigynum]|uniref:Uncharacterized protein n=1 Tax=Linum trigynum TaxID=586398 RepID=A0AAV2D944_9ROSI